MSVPDLSICRSARCDVTREAEESEMFLPTSVPPAPPAPHATLIQNGSMVLMATGILVVLVALPPVRNALRDLLERCTTFFYGPPRPAASAPTPVEDAMAEKPPTSRREIDEFDLDLFTVDDSARASR